MFYMVRDFMYRRVAYVVHRMSHFRFNQSIAAQHRQVCTDNWDDIWIIGDVHGCRTELELLLSKIDVGSNDLIVFVGDLIRKGPDNHGVVSLVRESPNMISVRGNNEEKVIRGEKDVAELTETDRVWIASLPVAISWDGHLVVHAGIDPRKPHIEQTVDDLLTIRSLTPAGDYDPPFWFNRYDEPARIAFGHTVLERPITDTSYIGIDTGCVYGGALTAYECTRNQVVSVEAERTIRERSADKFLTLPTSSAEQPL